MQLTYDTHDAPILLEALEALARNTRHTPWHDGARAIIERIQQDPMITKLFGTPTRLGYHTDYVEKP